MSAFRSALVSNASVQREPQGLGHADKSQNFSNRSTTYADETACTRQPHLRPGCRLHAVSSSYVIVMHCIGMDGPLTSWLHTPSDPCIIQVCSVVIVVPAAAHVLPRLACVDPVIVVWFLMGCMLHLRICFRSKGICLTMSPGGRVTSSAALPCSVHALGAGLHMLEGRERYMCMGCICVMCLHLYFSHCSPIEFGPDILSMVF